MSFEPDGVSRKEYDRLIAQIVDLTKLRLEDELVHGNVMGRIAIALFGDQNNRTDEECVARAAEIGYELSGAKQRAERAEAELTDARALLQKLRGAARLYRGGGVAGQQMGNESYSILVTGHTLGDIDAALASKPNE